MGKRAIYPSLEDFRKKAALGNLVPVYAEIMADMETPVSAFRKVNEGAYSFLLESVEGGEKWARYSFIGFNPSVVFSSKGKKIEILRDGKKSSQETKGDPLDELKKLMGEYRVVKDKALPRFFGGAVGYIGYDMVRFFEKLPDDTEDDLTLNDCVFLITDNILIFDGLRQKIKVVVNVHLANGLQVEEAYRRAEDQIEEVICLLKRPAPVSQGGTREEVPGEIASNVEKEAFEKIVLKAKDYIVAGDIIQVVLSQRFQVSVKADPFNIYRALRVVNPSPYMYYLKLEGLVIVGSSPEVLVRKEGRRIEIRPIAGTRPRGSTEEEDLKLEGELLADPKEIAEHIMLVDLGRNDVGRVAEMGSVQVSDFLVIERYSHVMHIVTNVSGTLEEDRDCFDVLRATFPAGTVSGAPKIRAMEIIEELEPSKRGPYAGAVGYFGFSGNMDFCITIRTMVIKDNVAYFQAGAGIVADSVPEREFFETVSKAKALVRAIEMTRDGLD